MDRYRQELEDKIKLAILKLFFRKGAAEKMGYVPEEPKKKKKKKKPKIEEEE